ncbi:MAG: hypothetical protein GY769_08775 [bacterium]|nr:hypothetical protein [bacterium]
MRARLLDMGEVSAVRSQSIYHAIAAAMGQDDSPVGVLLRPASSLVSIGVDRDPADEVDLESCLEDRIPVLCRRLGGGAEFVGPNRLLFDFLMPRRRIDELQPPTPEPLAETCRALGLPSTLGLSGEILTGEPGGPLRQVGRSQSGPLGESMCLAASLALDPEPPEHDSVLIGRRVTADDHTVSSLAAELAGRPDFSTVAEALVEAVEDTYEVELVPSMPTPAEMDAIYDWDERLALDLELAAGATSRRADQLVC